MSSLPTTIWTKAYNGQRFGIETGSCNIMKPKYGKKKAKALAIQFGHNPLISGSQVIMKCRSLSAANGKPRGLLL